ncbi:YceI family protein [Sphingomonas tabacisoli]|uniref:YceI family protein n=1 Tax=Sphingomonas tabacisoli TaxID=2249466 RepID=A0ABW4I2G3_9SPHN
MRRLLLLVLPLALAAPLVAQAPMSKPGSANPAAVTGGTYTADPNHTLVLWTVDHLGFTPYTGIFGSVTGTLTLDPKNPNAAKVDVTIPVSKVTTASAGLTEHLLKPGKDGGKPDFFGPSPADAHFVSTKVVAQGQKAKITGNLTLNGVTRPVTLDAAFYGAGKMAANIGGKENVGFRATTTIKRSDFGVMMGIPLVSDEVKLEIAAAFQK